MILKRRLYIVAFIIVIFIASAMIAFITHNNSTKNYKGTLVYNYSQEAVV